MCGRFQTIRLQQMAVDMFRHTSNPGCAPIYQAGWQDWRGGIHDDACFVDSNSSIETIDITGQLKREY